MVSWPLSTNNILAFNSDLSAGSNTAITSQLMLSKASNRVPSSPDQLCLLGRECFEGININILPGAVESVNWQNIVHLRVSQRVGVNMATNVALDTSMGTIVVELYEDHAPKTCKNFWTLAQRGYYNNVIFHRIIPNFMLQTGDPTGTGRGGSSIYGEKFNDEIHKDLKHTGAGILSMANAGPNTNGSQFFITLAPTPWLDGKHTIFGRVKSGLRIVQRMGLVKTDAEDRPLEEVKIIKARKVEENEED